MASRPRRSADSFVDRHGLWSAEQHRAAARVEKEIARRRLDLVRFSFADQHGTLRGKTLVASEAARAMRSGVTMTTTLLAKDPSHKTVFPVFAAGGGLGIPEMQGAGDFMMVADPTTFRVLPWAENTGWMLCDIVFTSGNALPLSTRAKMKDALARLDRAGYGYTAGLEVEFHLYRIEDLALATARTAWPPEPPAVSLTTQGFQYLTESRFDQVGPAMDALRRTVQALGLPLRSLEVELGPSQYEFTFAPQDGMDAADSMVLFRSAMKQAARRMGLLVSFMCRPGLPHAFSSGWHLHQSLTPRGRRANAFVAREPGEILSAEGRSFLAGLLAHANAGAAFASPTLNGYKRYHGVNTMAPVQAVWARDNRGAMVRVMGAPGDPATHLENRIGEPLANPYLYMASQIYAGLDGMARGLDPGPSADAPYEVGPQPLPAQLGEALDALAVDDCFRAGFGAGFVDYFVGLKRAEIRRAEAESAEPVGAAAVTPWEHREYFDLA